MTSFPKEFSSLKVQLCHDWLTGMRGGERVLEILCNGFPESEIFTLIHNAAAVSETINRHPIRTSKLQSVPAIFRYYRYFLPFFPKAVEGFSPGSADLMISTSHCVAKSIKTHPDTPHLCYCFTPMRYAWTFHEEYFGRNPLKRLLVAPVLNSLRKWDLETSSRVDRFAAISRHVADRIRKFYNRDSDIVYPPVDTGKFTPADRGSHNFDLIVSALVPYKRIDIAVEAYNNMKLPLKIVGAGTENAVLRRKAGPTIEFLGWQPDSTILDLYRNCRMLIFPGEEDFGIVPLEAQACGRPVIAYRKGGALETVLENVTGLFFDRQDPALLQEAVKKGSSQKWDPEAARRNSERFAIPNFISQLSRSISECLRK